MKFQLKNERQIGDMMRKPAGIASCPRKPKRLIIFIFLFLLMNVVAFGSENNAASIKAKPGSLIDLPIIIDKTENLAGVKLVINYDKDLLTFKEGNTTKNTRSLMCVINDKNPGRLIVVMAGAKGVSGKDLPSGRTARFDILETQLMNDQLKEIKGSVSIKPIEILPLKKVGQYD